MKKILSVVLLLLGVCVARAQTNCMASFTYNTSSTGYPANYNFVGSFSGSGPVTYSWDFGNGTTFTSFSPTATVTYTSGGGGTCVTLVASNGVCSDTSYWCFTIGTSFPPFCSLVSTSYTYTNIANTYTFNGNTTMNLYNALATARYEWNYGDGSPIDTTTSLQTTHAYNAPGIYNAQLIAIYDSSGVNLCIDTVTQAINVDSSSFLDCNNSYADFLIWIMGRKYSFTNYSNPLITFAASDSYLWDFGDGDTSTLRSPDHVYTSGGIYPVTLTVNWHDLTTNALLCSKSHSQTLYLTSNNINTQALWDSSMNADSASVMFWLISYDSASQTLTAVDSINMGCTAQEPFVYAEFTNKPAGNYRIKAHMLNQPANWTTGLLPTYADSSAFWNTATVINHTGSTTYANEIHLQQGIPLTGPGFIGGLVTQGANKGTAVGDPIPNLTLFLRDAANNPVASTETDASGNYSFSGVPLGSYSVYPEALSFATTPSATLQITATTTNLTGNNFKYEPGMMQINPASLSVSNKTTLNEISVFPNPAKDMVNIQFARAPEKGSVIRLLNLNGQVVRSETITTQTMQVSVSGLAAGTYLLQVPGTNTTYRIAVQK